MRAEVVLLLAYIDIYIAHLSTVCIRAKLLLDAYFCSDKKFVYISASIASYLLDIQFLYLRLQRQCLLGDKLNPLLSVVELSGVILLRVLERCVFNCSMSDILKLLSQDRSSRLLTKCLIRMEIKIHKLGNSEG